MKKISGPTINTAPYNVSGHPAISLNAGYIDGLPIGVMLVGKKFGEEKLLNLAYALEQGLKK